MSDSTTIAKPIRIAAADLERLVGLRHSDPHSILGAHPSPDGIIIRAFQPGAKRVAVIADRNHPWQMARVDHRGLFEVLIAGRPEVFPYELRVHYANGDVVTIRDPYAFLPTIGTLDLHLWNEGRHEQIYEKLGAHSREIDGAVGFAFAVWAPNARGVSVVGDFNDWDGRIHMMRSLGPSGIWELFIPGIGAGAHYKFEIRTLNGNLLLKADPFAAASEPPPATASITYESDFVFNDEEWMATRGRREAGRSPISIYEVHLGSWRRVPEEQHRSLTYRELAPRLAEYINDMGFTHVQLMPVMEHPFTGSWGYQVTGYFAPTARYGSPDDFRFLVDYLHRHGIGVILDWVPAHFPTDAFALGRFDGTALFEHLDARKGHHPEWDTYIFNYGRNEVRNFLIASALYWLGEFHADGLRVDAVASMLYLDYARNQGEWIPNQFGGRENLEAVDFIKALNQAAYARNPGIMMIAEESTAWPGVSRPTYLGGLGFGFKWDMGWMHDTLEYFSKDAIHRRYHHRDVTFGFLYAWTESFILPLSHDEVVHGKRSMLSKMPGDRWQQFANLRALYGYMWARPGKKMIFMGDEFGQWREWNHDESLDWNLLQYEDHCGLQGLMRELNRIYRDEPALWEADCEPAGFRFIDADNSDDNVVAFMRLAPQSGRRIICVCNFSPVVRDRYRIGVPAAGIYREILNTDSRLFGGGNIGNAGAVAAESMPHHGLEFSPIDNVTTARGDLVGSPAVLSYEISSMVEPRATYRVQLHSGFTFDDAADLTEYLAELGISHLYCSPYLQATPGSTHGYDVVDHRRVNEDLGGAAGHARLHSALREKGLGQILDIVPNHMAIVSPYNPWWWDVLENGPASNYSSYFDVDWETPEMRLRNSVLIPVLGDQYGEVLASGTIQLERDGAALTVRYHEHRFPVAPRSFDTILAAAAQRCGSDQLAFLSDSFGRLPLPTATDIESTRRRHRDKDVLQTLLARLIREQSEVGPAIDAVIAEINAHPDSLHSTLERQNFRLAYWRAASRDLGYRRFFDINTLVGLRMEDRRVFADTHFLVMRWLADGTLDGVRVDHIDGLRDPEQYLQWLHQAQPNAWILVEKILEAGESLRESWPIAGTTGYDFLNVVGALLVDPAGERPLTRFYTEFTGERTDFAQIVLEKKDLVMRDVLGSDLNRLTALFVEVCECHPRHRDYTRHELHEAIRAAVARMPVYRTYVREAADAPIYAEDERYVGSVIDAAKLDRPDIDPRLFDFLHDILLLRQRGDLEAELAMRFQQFTGPVMAKSVEDTAFYCFNRFAALNEVGGDPARFSLTIEEFHRDCELAQTQWPLRMLATSTHDTKRSEDLRARMSLLAEIPEQWIAAVRGWSEMNRPWWRGGLSDRNAEYLFYQTLVGAWPIERERIVEYMRKAAREAKLRTSWTAPNEEYERSLTGFIEGVLDNPEFVNELTAFVTPLIWPGRVNALAQTLIKITAPGVPDFYQGSELWSITLVDPDNRRAIDYAQRRRLLAALHDLPVEQIVARADEGLPKLWLIRQALDLRRRCPQLFGRDGNYRPLPARGARAEHAIAFSRGAGAITIAPRLPIGLAGEWDDTVIALPRGRWRNVLTGDTLDGGETALAKMMQRFPVCLLAAEEIVS